jgi:tetratricopeptide (TPR) repeat protein
MIFRVTGSTGLYERRLQEAQMAFDEANTFWDAGKYADAIARGEHALALREAMLGSTHPDVARCLDMLGFHHLRRGDSAQAEPLLQRALAIVKAALGRNHPGVATLESCKDELLVAFSCKGRGV